MIFYPRTFLKRSGRRFNILGFAFLIALFSFSSLSTQAEVSPVKGKELFKAKCATCHRTDGKPLTGPGLAGILDRRDEAWIIKWVQNNAAVRKSGDPYALEIFNKFGKTEMTLFPDLSDDDVRSILAFVVNGVPGEHLDPKDPKEPVGETDYTSILWVIITSFLLLTILLFRVNKNLTRMAKEKLGEEIPAHRSWMQRLKSRKTLATVIMILVIVTGYEMVIGAQKLGRSQGYQPIQPINFPHSLHAGINKIDCKYCHAGVEKSKTASIPSINVCMNCHKGVSEGETEAGTKEIQKIYYYAGFDPETRTYSRKPHEVKWIKIHNLPDHVYFNHSQHVVAGKLACQKCHGPIETMDEVYQFASLSMGWCINCHRNTKVQFKENNYYSTLFEDLHEKLNNHSIDSVTVEQVGGTECQKCHY